MGDTEEKREEVHNDRERSGHSSANAHDDSARMRLTTDFQGGSSEKRSETRDAKYTQKVKRKTRSSFWPFFGSEVETEITEEGDVVKSEDSTRNRSYRIRFAILVVAAIVLGAVLNLLRGDEELRLTTINNALSVVFQSSNAVENHPKTAIADEATLDSYIKELQSLHERDDILYQVVRDEAIAYAAAQAANCRLVSVTLLQEDSSATLSKDDVEVLQRYLGVLEEAVSSAELSMAQIEIDKAGGVKYAVDFMAQANSTLLLRQLEYERCCAMAIAVLIQEADVEPLKAYVAKISNAAASRGHFATYPLEKTLLIRTALIQEEP